MTCLNACLLIALPWLLDWWSFSSRATWVNTLLSTPKGGLYKAKSKLKFNQRQHISMTSRLLCSRPNFIMKNNHSDVSIVSAGNNNSYELHKIQDNAHGHFWSLSYNTVSKHIQQKDSFCAWGDVVLVGINVLGWALLDCPVANVCAAWVTLGGRELPELWVELGGFVTLFTIVPLLPWFPLSGHFFVWSCHWKSVFDDALLGTFRVIWLIAPNLGALLSCPNSGKMV